MKKRNRSAEKRRQKKAKQAARRMKERAVARRAAEPEAAGALDFVHISTAGAQKMEVGFANEVRRGIRPLPCPECGSTDRRWMSKREESEMSFPVGSGLRRLHSRGTVCRSCRWVGWLDRKSGFELTIEGEQLESALEAQGLRMEW